jgi:hypothetical protein
MLHWKVRFTLLVVSAVGLSQALGAIRLLHAGFAW